MAARYSQTIFLQLLFRAGYVVAQRVIEKKEASVGTMYILKLPYWPALD